MIHCDLVCFSLLTSPSFPFPCSLPSLSLCLQNRLAVQLPKQINVYDMEALDNGRLKFRLMVRPMSRDGQSARVPVCVCVCLCVCLCVSVCLCVCASLTHTHLRRPFCVHSASCAGTLSATCWSCAQSTLSSAKKGVCSHGPLTTRRSGTCACACACACRTSFGSIPRAPVASISTMH